MSLSTAGLRAETVSCDPEAAPTLALVRVPADVVLPRQLAVERPWAGTGKLRIYVCNADLQVRARRDLDHLRLTITLRDQPNGHTAQEYVKRFRVEPDSAELELKFLHSAHATVTLETPMLDSSETEVNVGSGDLKFDAVGSAGQRMIHVGMGHVDLTTGGVHSYGNLALNIGMGSVHDHRPGGRNGYFVVSRSDGGDGSGSIAINVGMGSLDLRE